MRATRGSAGVREAETGAVSGFLVITNRRSGRFQSEYRAVVLNFYILNGGSSTKLCWQTTVNTEEHANKLANLRNPESLTTTRDALDDSRGAPSVYRWHNFNLGSLPVCLSIYPLSVPVYLSVRLSICPSVRQSVCSNTFI